MPSNGQLSRHDGTHLSLASVGPFRRFTSRFALALLGAAVTFGCDLPVAPYQRSDSLTTPSTGAPAPAVPGYTLTLTAPTLTIAQGGGGGPPNTTVNLVRTDFTGEVTISVENLPTGVHFFYPNSPMSSSSAQLGLAVQTDAPTGTFANVLVRGVADGLPDQTAPLTLTITGPPYTLTLSSTTLTVVQDVGAQTTTVHVVRNNFTGPVTLFVDWFDSMPPGITGTFAPAGTEGNTSVLTFTASGAAVPGVYALYVFGRSATTTYCCVPFTLTVISP